jgi:hypothetical protein
MKNKIILMLCLLPLCLRAVDYSQIQVINWLAPNPDSLAKGGQKINDNFILLAGWIADLSTNPPGSASIQFTNTVTGAPGSSAAVADLGGGVFQLTIPQGLPGTNGANGTNGVNGTSGTNGASATVAVGTVTTGAAGSSATVVNVGTSMAAVFNFAIPRGADGAPGTNTVTNTVTAYNFTNQVLASKQIIAYSTNYAYWDRVANGSNYLGRFQGIVDWNIFGGDNGGNPPSTMNMTIWGSFSGTNGWFALTNNYWTTNWISIAVLTNGYRTVGGGPIAKPGSATIFTMDHWELYGRTNYFDYQRIRLNKPPIEGADIANKAYVDTMVANVKDGSFTSYSDTNSVFHFVYNRNNSVTFDMWNSISFVPMAYTGLDGTGTNMLISAMQTNLANGFTFESSTNLALVNGFVTFTNWTTNTVSGVTTFTVPLNMNEPQRFFRITKSASSGSAFNSAVAFNGGTIYPSNTWNFADLTNRLAAFGPGKHYWTGSSNGQALVTLSYSNGVVRYVRADY